MRPQRQRAQYIGDGSTGEFTKPKGGSLDGVSVSFGSLRGPWTREQKYRAAQYTEAEMGARLADVHDKAFSFREGHYSFFMPPVPTGLPPTTHTYNGSYYVQKERDSCMPWSIVNASLAVGVSLSPTVVTEMVNDTLARGSGLEAEAAAAILGGQSAGVRLDVLRPTKTEQWGGRLQPFDITNTATFVRDTIDQGGTLVASLLT